MRHLAAALLILAIAAPAGATAQMPDRLKIGRSEYELHSNPLEVYRAKNRVSMPPAGVVSSALWRGYIAEWAVHDGKLLLEDVKVPTEHYTRADDPSKRYFSAMKPLFGNAAPRVATWFTGHLIVPTGGLVHYVHMGYGSTYSSYVVITVVNGVVQNQRVLEQSGFEAFRRKQFAAYKRTPEYAAERAQVGEDGEAFLFEYATATYLSRVF
jgi:hypothetical protein